MTWVAVGVAGAGLIGGFLNKKSGDQAAANSKQMSEEDRKFTEHMYDKSLSDNRADQTNDFGTLGWTKDANGKWTQTSHLNPAEAARLEDYRQIAADRMSAAKGGYKTDWNSLGFGKLANAVLGTPGDTGARSWANQKTASTANDFMRNGQAPPNMAAQMGIGPSGPGGPGSAQAGLYPQQGVQGANFSDGSAPSGGGSMLGAVRSPPGMGPTTDFAPAPPQQNAVVSGNHVQIAPGYKPGSQYAPPPAVTPTAPPVRTARQPLADALRNQVLYPTSDGSNGSG